MAGRGSLIYIKLLGDLAQIFTGEEISLEVAMHTPLHILKDQLAAKFKIPTPDQVLQLCNRSVTDGGKDILLNGKDGLTLSACGITEGSLLSLHSLNIVSITQDSKHDFKIKPSLNLPILNITTKVPPNLADHSFNGVIFDVKCNGPYEVTIYSIFLAGMLGKIKIFARDRPWEDLNTHVRPNHYQVYSEGLPTTGWEIVTEEQCSPSWDTLYEIKLVKPIHLGPYQRRGIYCHSNLPHDLGIQYQSYKKNDLVALDQYLTIFPGLGHTGREPFDVLDGWFRFYRGLAGSMAYQATWKAWSIERHREFLPELQALVKTVLLCNNRVIPGNTIYSIASLPLHLIYYILEYIHYDWYLPDKVDMEESEEITVPKETGPIIRFGLLHHDFQALDTQYEAVDDDYDDYDDYYDDYEPFEDDDGDDDGQQQQQQHHQNTLLGYEIHEGELDSSDDDNSDFISGLSSNEYFMTYRFDGDEYLEEETTIFQNVDDDVDES